MSLKQKLILCFLYCISLSCKTERRYKEEFFSKNVETFQTMVSHIRLEIPKHNYLKYSPNLIFVDEATKSFKGNFIHDKYLSHLMKKVKIKQIICTNNNEDFCGYFDEISFQFLNEQVKPDKVIYYIYSLCDNNKSYQKKDLYQQKLRSNWVLFIDET